jgi:hypothetical protein
VFLSDLFVEGITGLQSRRAEWMAATAITTVVLCVFAFAADASSP